MMAITTSSSISVKPRRWCVREQREHGCTMAVGRILESVSRGRTVSRRLSLPIRHFFQLRHVPDLDRLIAASRDQAPAVGAERHAADEAGVTAEGADQLPGAAVPDLHGAVLTRRGDPPAIVVGAERHGVNVPACVPGGSAAPCRSRTSQILTVFSSPPVASRRPSGLKATFTLGPGTRASRVRRGSGFPSRCSLSRRVASQSFTIPSPLAEARCPPSRLKTTPRISRSWVPSVPTSRPVSASQTCTAPFRSPRDQVAAVGAERHGEVRQAPEPGAGRLLVRSARPRP